MRANEHVSLAALTRNTAACTQALLPALGVNGTCSSSAASAPRRRHAGAAPVRRARDRPACDARTKNSCSMAAYNHSGGAESRARTAVQQRHNTAQFVYWQRGRRPRHLSKVCPFSAALTELNISRHRIANEALQALHCSSVRVILKDMSLCSAAQ